MHDVRLDLSIDETNLVLEALGQLPFARVFQLIGKIQRQAQDQAEASGGPEPSADAKA